METGAFQADAFQIDAFQIDDDAGTGRGPDGAVASTPAPQGTALAVGAPGTATNAGPTGTAH